MSSADSGSPSSLALPHALGRGYTLLRQLARGGFGVVFVAADAAGGRVAVKLVAGAPRAVEAAAREAALLRELGAHAHVVRLLDAFLAREGFALVLELCTGGSLAPWIAERPPPGERRVARAARGALRALAHLHARGVVHRDVKPSNLLLAARGVVKLADFGLAQRGPDAAAEEAAAAAAVAVAVVVAGAGAGTGAGTGTGFDSSAGGTPAYMSPEAARGRPATAASDIWAAGATAFALATGRTMLAGFSPLAALYRLANDEAPPLEADPPPAGTSAELVDFLRQCLQRDAALRPSAEALLAHPFVAEREEDERDAAEWGEAEAGAEPVVDAEAEAEDEGDELRACVPRGLPLQLVAFAAAPDALWSSSPGPSPVPDAKAPAAAFLSSGAEPADEDAGALAGAAGALTAQELAARLRALGTRESEEASFNGL